ACARSAPWPCAGGGSRGAGGRHARRRARLDSAFRKARMTPGQVLDEFRAAGALLEGHFILSSGLHSSVFFQKNAVFMDPARTERLCRALAQKAEAAFGNIDVVVSEAGCGRVAG